MFGEVAVHHVQMNPVRTGLIDGADFFAELANPTPGSRERSPADEMRRIGT
jgi:hypothetical protein